jgi:PncC family amidohydrolase
MQHSTDMVKRTLVRKKRPVKRSDALSGIITSLFKRFAANGATLSVAESCTGGGIGAAITGKPGASKFFFGGVISYDNRIKEKIVGVPRNTLAAHGAVSRETVLAMAKGVRNTFGTDYSIAVSGIAGPDGGTPARPVGLVWIAVATPKKTFAKRFLFSGNRHAVRMKAVKAAIALLLKSI